VWRVAPARVGGGRSPHFYALAPARDAVVVC